MLCYAEKPDISITVNPTIKVSESPSPYYFSWIVKRVVLENSLHELLLKPPLLAPFWGGGGLGVVGKQVQGSPTQSVSTPPYPEHPVCATVRP